MKERRNRDEKERVEVKRLVGRRRGNNVKVRVGYETYDHVTRAEGEGTETSGPFLTWTHPFGHVDISKVVDVNIRTLGPLLKRD